MKKTFLVIGNYPSPTNKYHREVVALEMDGGELKETGLPDHGFVRLCLNTGRKKGRAVQESIPTGLILDVLPLDIIEVEVLDFQFRQEVIDPYTLKFVGRDKGLVTKLAVNNEIIGTGLHVVKATECAIARGKMIFEAVGSEAMPVVDPHFNEHHALLLFPEHLLVILNKVIIAVLEV